MPKNRNQLKNHPFSALQNVIISCFKFPRKDTIPIQFVAKVPRLGTIGKNHIQSSSALSRTALFACSESDTFLMNLYNTPIYFHNNALNQFRIHILSNFPHTKSALPRSFKVKVKHPFFNSFLPSKIKQYFQYKSNVILIWKIWLSLSADIVPFISFINLRQIYNPSPIPSLPRELSAR